MSSKIYNDHTASSFNLDSNGGKDNQEIHRYAGMHTMFQANKGQEKLPATPIAESKQKTTNI